MRASALLLAVALAAGLSGYLLGRAAREDPPAAPGGPIPREAPCRSPEPAGVPQRPHPSAAETPPGDSRPPLPRAGLPPPAAPPRRDLYDGSLVHTPNGTLKVVGSDGSYSLVREGAWIEFHPDGSKRSEVEYRAGVMDGTASYWHANGRLSEEGRHAGGKKQGIWTLWDEEGNRICEGEWESGVLTGPLCMWDSSKEFPSESEALEKARVDGKYRGLLLRIAAPKDRERYPDFHDFGYYRKTDYLGHEGVPAGYWVYVYPYWYVWREMTGPQPPQEDVIRDLRKHIDPIKRE